MTPTLARRPRLIAGAALFIVTALAVAGWTFAPRGAVEATGRTGPRLAIAVVPPVEPEIDPGTVLEVGALNDGFDRAVLDRRPEINDPTWMPADAYAGETWPPLDPPRMPPATPVTYATEGSQGGHDPLADGSTSFGFDRMGSRDPVQHATRSSGTGTPLAWTPPLSSAPASPDPYTQGTQYSSE